MQSTNRRGFLRAGAGLGALAATALIPGKIANRVLGKEVELKEVEVPGRWHLEVERQGLLRYDTAWPNIPLDRDGRPMIGPEQIQPNVRPVPNLHVVGDYQQGAWDICVWGLERHQAKPGDIFSIPGGRYTVIACRVEERLCGYDTYLELDRGLEFSLSAATPFKLEKHQMMTADLGPADQQMTDAILDRSTFTTNL